MNKEEILKKSRNANCDEMKTYYDDKSYRFIFATMVIVAGIFSMIRGFRDEPIMDLCATVMTSISVGYFYRYSKVREKSMLYMAVFTMTVAILATIRFFMGH